MSDSLLQWATLALSPGVGPQRFLQLIQRFGSAAAALAARPAQLEGILERDIAEQLGGELAQQAATAALAWAEADNCQLVTLLDNDYPTQLAEAGAPPALLFARGRRELLAAPMIAIVGSRNSTPQGDDNARSFARNLAANGYSIVSGLAEGIDAAAHQGALEQPAGTVAVIGTGIDRIYPARNRELAHQIASQGLILSEFPLGTPPAAQNFPRRNRIIAGLARGCLVVEATPQSGSLITARLALEAGREVMAIPGSIHNPQARGCHKLIKDGARLVETVDDVLDEVGRIAAGRHPSAKTRRAGASAESRQEQGAAQPPLLAAMGFDPVDADTLAGRLGLTPGEVYAMLLELEIQGLVDSMPGGRYQRRAGVGDAAR
ncbi:DNA-processing protein DprA [Vogesella sp. LIG4]|uniref:DNA-processing protein DprA n=1 Tax=Vogesella sp. LIG4 TaxID=1192162 RepID=UPI00081F759E|nr:DNA-processing protein DprA [Vogesella sp. LIG4]SCK10499.1 DNA processing protein [Vogesella sp. LIG4]